MKEILEVLGIRSCIGERSFIVVRNGQQRGATRKVSERRFIGLQRAQIEIKKFEAKILISLRPNSLHGMFSHQLMIESIEQQD